MILQYLAANNLIPINPLPSFRCFIHTLLIHPVQSETGRVTLKMILLTVCEKFMDVGPCVSFGLEENKSIPVFLVHSE